MNKYEEAESTLSLTKPYNFRDVKATFRSKIKLAHPDQGGSVEEVEKVLEAYNILKCAEHIDGSTHLKECTVGGTPIGNLGLGLGPLVNGVTCDKCKGDGYTTDFGISYKVCDHCDENGYELSTVQCNKCFGSGKFQQARSKRIVDCLACKGTGLFIRKSKYRQLCIICGGTKTIWSKDENKIVYKECYNCDGTGETQIYNPVIQKGSLAIFNE